MRLLYVAGPYRSKLGPWGVAQNIERARVVARELWAMGFAVICPHSNTAMMDGTDTDSLFLEGDLVMLERCDMLVAVEGWQNSAGTLGEIEHAKEHGIPVLFWPEDREAIDTIAAEPPAFARETRTITVKEAAAILGKHAAERRRMKRSEPVIATEPKPGQPATTLFEEAA
jgi:nucleoside 2-deoxyribosyltransferase